MSRWERERESDRETNLIFFVTLCGANVPSCPYPSNVLNSIFKVLNDSQFRC